MASRITFLVSLIVVITSNSFYTQTTEKNFYDLQKEFNDYWKDKPHSKGDGYKLFKRLEWYAEPRVYPSGKLEYASRSKSYEEYQKYLQKHKNSKIANITNGNWTPLGPYGNHTFDPNVNPSQSNISGTGRVSFIKYHPTNSSKVFVGSPSGGLWVSTDGGNTYTTNTDLIAKLGCSDLAFDSSNPNIMYLATGDYDNGIFDFSLGLLKSTDGGTTWLPTGLTFQATDLAGIAKVVVSPSNSSIIIVATNKGLYRSTNAGVSFNVVQVGSFSDVKYKPGDPNTIYAVSRTEDNGNKAAFYKSTNGGSSFLAISINGSATNSNINRYAIGVTPAKPGYVYLVSYSHTSYGFYALYKSTNSGSSFTTMSTNSTLSDEIIGSQGYYNLAIAVSPTNGNELIIGGLTIWKSTNGGVSWTEKCYFHPAANLPYVHEDIHYLEYLNASTFIVGSDGGIFKTTNGGTSFTCNNGNLNIALFYSLSATNNLSHITAGSQDNGTCLNKGSGSWYKLYYGDGVNTLIDRSDNNTIVTTHFGSAYQKSVDGGKTFMSISVPGSTSSFYAPIIQSYSNPNVFYGGSENLYKSTNKGNTWTLVTDFGISSPDPNKPYTVEQIAEAPSNPNVLYVVKANNLFKTTDGGTTWVNITGTFPSTNGPVLSYSSLPTGFVAIRGVTVNNTNPNDVYVCFSGYENNEKVYHSLDGGATWVNYSGTNLPNIPVNCIAYQNNSAGVVYIGTDQGVYVKSKNMNDWIPWNDGLPNIEVMDIEINNSSNKIIAATYGRGVWKSDLFDPASILPTVTWGLNTTNYSPCPDSLYKFMGGGNYNNPTGWVWGFSNGNPSTSTAQNPAVTFPVFSNTTSTLVPCWVYSTNTWGKSDTSYFVTTVLPKPTKPTITQIGGTLYAPTTYNNYDWYYNNSLTSNYYDYMNVIGPGSYRVQVYLSTSPCPAISDQFTVMSTNIADGLEKDDLFLLQNPVKDQLLIGSSVTMTEFSSYEITNQLGQSVKKGKIRLDRDNVSLINLTELKTGVYYLNLLLQDKVNTQKFIKE